MALTVRRWVAVLVLAAVAAGGVMVACEDPNPWGQTVRRR